MRLHPTHVDARLREARDIDVFEAVESFEDLAVAVAKYVARNANVKPVINPHAVHREIAEADRIAADFGLRGFTELHRHLHRLVPGTLAKMEAIDRDRDPHFVLAACAALDHYTGDL